MIMEHLHEQGAGFIKQSSCRNCSLDRQRGAFLNRLLVASYGFMLVVLGALLIDRFNVVPTVLGFIHPPMKYWLFVVCKSFVRIHPTPMKHLVEALC